MVKLKNYTSTVPAAKSIAYIEAVLLAHNVTKTQKTAENGRVTALCFAMNIDGSEVYFKLPARIANCEKVLQSKRSRRIKPETAKKIAEQAERTALKIISDWVEAQMAMIELAQIKPLEVFLPYVLTTGTVTFYEALEAKGYKGLLPEGKS